MEGGIFVELVCLTCSESRYKSKVLIDPSTKITPDMFESIGEQPPAETFKNAAAPTCYACNGKLAPMPSKKQQPPITQQSRRTVELVDEEPGGVTTLFEVRDGEQVLDISNTNGKLLVQTNQRILLIDLGGL